MKILLAADGSEHSRKAAKQLVKYVKFLAEAPEIHLDASGAISPEEAADQVIDHLRAAGIIR